MAIEIKIQGEPEDIAILIRLLDRNVTLARPLIKQAIRAQGAAEVGKALADAYSESVQPGSLEPIKWPKRKITKSGKGKSIAHSWTSDQVRQILTLAASDWSLEKTDFIKHLMETFGAARFMDIHPGLYDAVVKFAQDEVEKARTRILQEVKGE